MKVSVIIPIYNVENYVEECIQSVKVQTLTDLEILCIHDAGQDGSWEIVKRLAHGDPRFRLYENEKNLGLAATRNRGLDRARGEYVYFLDSDDKIQPEAMEQLYERAKKEGLEVQIFGSSFLYETPELKEKFKTNRGSFKRSYPDVMNGRDLFIAWMDAWDWLPSQPRYFYERAFLEKNHIRFIEGMLHEDENFSFDVLLHAERIRVTDDPFFVRRFRAASIMTGGPTIRNVEGCVKILDHVSSFQDIYGNDPKWNQAVKYYMYKIFLDVCRKYRSAAENSSTPLFSRLSPEMKENASEMRIYHLIEANAMWESGTGDGSLSHCQKMGQRTVPCPTGQSSAGKKQLYACSSYYQLLIALMKVMTENQRADLVLEEHGIETAEELAERLPKQLGEWIDRVYICRTNPAIDPYQQRLASFVPWQRRKLLNYMGEVFQEKASANFDENPEALLKEKYEKIHIFWDLGYLGTYCNIRKIPYTLHEDSLNSYQHIRKNRPHYAYLFGKRRIWFYMKKMFHMGVIPFGYSPYCQEIEVNEKKGIEIPLNKVVERPRKELEQKLSTEQKKKIFTVFTEGMKWNPSMGEGAVLLLTEPFAGTGRLPDRETQARLYKDILTQYAPGSQVVIKPHPRDELDYRTLFPEAIYMEKNIPMEVLNFEESFHFSKAITVTSSAIQGIQGAEEKITLGAEYWKKYR